MSHVERLAISGFYFVLGVAVSFVAFGCPGSEPVAARDVANARTAWEVHTP